MAATVFFSYSHDDESYRDQLEKHLALLLRQGLIEAWHDRRIHAGAEVDASIDGAMEVADIILLLVSASFIASPYCYSREMARAMERQEAKQATVIPVIVRPCDWHSAPFGKLLAVPTDGKAITQWPNADEAYTNISQHVRAVVDRLKPSSSLPAMKRAAEAPAPAGKTLPRSSNLRLKKEFTDLDADTFLSEAFEFMARFFEGSLAELSERNPGVDGRFRRIDSRTFSAAIYKNGKKQSECAIQFEAGGLRRSGITFSHGVSEAGNSYNEQVSVRADDQALFLRALGMSTPHGQDDQKLSAEGASELFWSMLIEHLQ